VINPEQRLVKTDDKGVRTVLYGRQYPWGFCDALSDSHSDFNRLYKLITSKEALYHLITLFIDVLWSKLIECTDKSIMPTYIEAFKEEE
jgi:hypothetical protein